MRQSVDRDTPKPAFWNSMWISAILTRPRPREQVIRDPALHLIGLLRVRTTVIAVLLANAALSQAGTEAAQRLQHDARLRCDPRQGNPMLIKAFT